MSNDWGFVQYAKADETLDAIALGMDANEHDEIVSVGASGGPALALLEKVKRVVIVDCDLSQIKFNRHKAELLRQGNYEEFLDLLVGAERDYFQSPSRLSTLTAKIDNLEIRDHCNIITEPDKIFRPDNPDEMFTKFYASNVYTYCYYNNAEYLPKSLESVKYILNHIHDGGLIYTSDPVSDQIVPPYLKLDEDLTKIARDLEKSGRNWTPSVYRKIGK